MCATNPTPHESFSIAGSYSPDFFGKPNFKGVWFLMLIKLFSYELQAINRNRFRSLRPDFNQSVAKAIVQYRINGDLVERLSRPRFSTKSLEQNKKRCLTITLPSSKSRLRKKRLNNSKILTI